MATATKEHTAHSNASSKTRPYRARAWAWWLIPRPFDLVSSLLYIGALVPYLYNFVTQSGYTPPVAWWQATFMTVITVALLAVDRVEYFFYGEETPPRSAASFLLVRIVFIEVLSLLDRFQYTPFLYLILPYLACLYFGELVGYVLTALAWIMYFVKHTYYGPGWLNNGTEQHYLVLFTVGLILAVTTARVVVREKASRARAEAYAAQVAELATTQERNRLARDIHDTLGHFLTVINVQLEKALAFRDKKPLEADQAVSNAKRLASEALQDVRRSVGTLRATQGLPELIPSLHELVEHVRSTTCTVELLIEGTEDGFSTQGILALYRTVQEGLTNIQRHAGASHIWVNLCLGEQEGILVLRDNGHGFDTAKWQQREPGREGGYGLQGVQERLELVGGKLQIESAPGQGTTLRVTLPKNDYMLIDDRRG
ncbi:MAG: sensor histidine kinase [Ktedonobacteraceae bacterium]|nr:sensor histidine kinase [Ktedonobacteraceae bacterium]